MKVFLSPEAEQDLVEGGLYYSREASEDLGRALISEFERSAALLAEKPHFGARWLEQVRRFPYNIVYYIKQTEVRVLAVAHQSPKPGFWRDRM